MAAADSAAAGSNVEDSGPTGYRGLASVLLGQIKNEVWKIGDRLPTESELQDRYGVSRNTAREALRQLEELGHIRRHRGTRAVLVSNEPTYTYVNSIHSVEEMVQYARYTEAAVVETERVRLSEEIAKQFGAKPNSEWVKLSVVRTIERTKTPLSYSHIYIDPRFADIVPHMAEKRTAYTLIRDMFGVEMRLVDQVVSAACADAGLAALLRVPVGSPLLVVRTKFHASDGRLVEVGVTRFPASRYEVRMSLEKKGGSRGRKSG